ncbi:AraC family transcriptional regulator [Ohtaekwangia sp.]|uniref:AraC family transcriptional regulator n=1 Tax=Ohtaekwangia sp. TaxID=2066019 RepID=UPI002FDF0537
MPHGPQLIFYDKMKILAKHLSCFVDYGQLRGIPVRELRKVMKSPPDFADANAKVSLADFYAVVQHLSLTLNDPLLGIHVGQCLNLNTLGAIYRISLKATTNEEALHYCQSYLRKTFPNLTIHNATAGRTATTSISLPPGHETITRYILETILTVMAREIAIISGEDINVKLSSPHHTSDYPPEWKKGTTFEIKFNQTLLKAAMQDNTRWGLDLLIPEYLALIESMEAQPSFGSKVKLTALRMAKPRLPALETLAGFFNLNARTFQRRLVAENTTFRQITDDLKRDISNLLMLHDRFSITDIASVLGYSEPAAFIHSFKKWHGHPPQKMRDFERVAR